MEPEFTYYAFISYSHEDEAFAEKLHHYLEHYKLPSMLCRKFPHLIKRLRPIFLDSKELEISNLSDALKGALAASRYLIVLCSENSLTPNSEGKNWIDEEIRMFLDLRPENKKRIIPVILRSEGGKKAHEYLLPTIRKLDLLGVDVFKLKEARAFNDVIAKMHGLKPDELWNRHLREEEEAKRRRRIKRGVAAVLAAVVGWCCWYLFAPHARYYEDYIERNNLPEGVHELTKEEMKKRYRHYRFTHQLLRLRRVEYCNAVGTPQEHEEIWQLERPACIKLGYGNDGQVNQSIYYNSRGNKTLIRGMTPSSINFQQPIHTDEGEDVVNLSAPLLTSLKDTEPDSDKSSIGRFFVQRQKDGINQGVIIRELFCQHGVHTSAQDAQGVGGRSYELGTSGRPTQVSYLSVLSPSVIDAKTAPMATQQGVAGYRLTYDKHGRLSTLTYINREGQPTLNEEQWAELRLEYDDNGNITKKAYYGADETPCLFEGYASVSYKYDDRGNRSEDATYGVDGQLCADKNGCARCTMTYDKRGNMVEQVYYDENKNRCQLKNNVSRLVWRYDIRGNMIEERFFDRDDKPCRYQDLAACITWGYDMWGRRKSEAYFDEGGHPCLSADGYALWEATYDMRGNKQEVCYYGTDGKLRRNKDGYARAEYGYDGRGNRTEEKYFDENDNPCLHVDGYARRVIHYNERGNKMEEIRYGVDKQELERKQY